MAVQGAMSMRTRTTGLLLLLVCCVAAGADESLLMRELVPCFTQAERTRVAASLVKSGQSREVLEAQLAPAYAGVPAVEWEKTKAALHDASADRPADAEAYVAQKLNQCVAATSLANKQHITRPCYEVTLHADELYAAKKQGLALEQVKASTAQTLARIGKSADYVTAVQNMAGAIYGIDQPASIFRARWFASCVIQSK
jgi:hypothetical protein